VASDKNVRASVIAQTPFFLLFPDTVASRCMAAIAEKLIKHHQKAGDIPLELFWDNCLSFLEKHSPRKHQKIRDTRTGNADPDLGERLSQMEEKLSFLVKEMGDIRELLETRVLTAARIEEGPCPEPHKILLDFESWFTAKKG
jgi:flagellar biosynthesis protein FlhG